MLVQAPHFCVIYLELQLYIDVIIYLWRGSI